MEQPRRHESRHETSFRLTRAVRARKERAMQQMRSRVAGIGIVLVFFGTGVAAQGETLRFTATLTGACAQTDSIVVGSGIFTLDTDTGLFTYDVTHEPLPSGQIFAHIHGPLADACSQQGGGMILITLEPPIGSATLDAQEQADLIAGLYYVNIHSNVHDRGEISGIIEPAPPVPTVSTWGAVVLILLVLTTGTLAFRSSYCAAV